MKQSLEKRTANKSKRTLGLANSLVDFSSNDYFGFAKSESIFYKTHRFLIDKGFCQNGATGSRLLSGNYKLYEEAELFLSAYHQVESALIFNSGYVANLGLFACVAQRKDIILYDELIHASVRDGILISNAKSYKFKHNDVNSLNTLIEKNRKNKTNAEIYVVTESVFSMDGDSPDLKEIASVCSRHNAKLIVDEAHALGVFYKGLVYQLNLQKDVFATIVAFGKAMGCHGAAVLGSSLLKEYLINFSRPFIYTTGLPPHSIANIIVAYNEMDNKIVEKLQKNITFFKKKIKETNLNFIKSYSAIHSCIIGGNEKTKQIATKLQKNGINIKPILHPTVKKGKERLRICLHTYNSKQEISNVINLLKP